MSILDWSLPTAVIVIVATVALLVNLRKKMLYDLELLRALDESKLDPGGSRSAFVKEAFDMTFRLAYGWAGLLPVVFIVLGSFAVTLAGVTIWLGLRIGSGAIAATGVLLLCLSPIYLLIGWRMMKGTSLRRYMRLLGGGTPEPPAEHPEAAIPEAQQP